MQCRFCYSKFSGITEQNTKEEAEQIIRLLADAGTQKITFVGGEPTLHPHLSSYLKLANQLGMTTVVVTNGTKIREIIEECSKVIDWIGVDIDSCLEETEKLLGRGTGDHISNMIHVANLCHEQGIKLKLNTVVTSLSWQEDMSKIVKQVRPNRWKAFQVLPVKGQNDEKIKDLLITPEQFSFWVNKHQSLGVIAETNELMSQSYALIDPIGRFYTGDIEGHHYGKSILEVGVEKAWSSVNFQEDKFHARNGQYNWR